MMLLLLALYLVFGLPFVGWLARRLGRAHDDHGPHTCVRQRMGTVVGWVPGSGDPYRSATSR
jgi:hypothetical protein